MTQDLKLDVGYRYVCVPLRTPISCLTGANFSIVPRGSYVLRPLCDISASHDCYYKEAGSYLFPGKYHCYMGRDNGGMLISSPNNIIKLTFTRIGNGLYEELETDACMSNNSWSLGSRFVIHTSHIVTVGRGLIALGYFPGCVYLLSSWYVRCKY